MSSGPSLALTNSGKILPWLSLYLSLAPIAADSDRDEGRRCLINLTTADRTLTFGSFCHLGKKGDRVFFELVQALLATEIDLHWNCNTPISRPALYRAGCIDRITKGRGEGQN